MEAVKCQHKEHVDSTPALPGIEIGTCSRCGQMIQYDHRNMKTIVTLTRLGRLNGNIVLPKPGLQLLLSAEDTNDLKNVSTPSLPSAASPPEPSPEPAPEAAAPSPAQPRKHQKRRARKGHDEYMGASSQYLEERTIEALKELQKETKE